MKRKILKPEINRVLAAALVVFLGLVLAAFWTLWGPAVLKSGPTPKSDPGAEVPVKIDPPASKVNLEKMASSSLFPAPPPGVASAGGASTGTPAAGSPPVLGRNEVRDPSSGRVYRFLGVARDGSEPRACFLRLGTAPDDESKTLCLPKGGVLSPKLTVIEVGDTSVKVGRGGQVLNFKVFFVDLRGPEKIRGADKEIK